MLLKAQMPLRVHTGKLSTIGGYESTGNAANMQNMHAAFEEFFKNDLC